MNEAWDDSFREFFFIKFKDDEKEDFYNEKNDKVFIETAIL